MEEATGGGFLTERIVIERKLGDDGCHHIGASFLGSDGEMIDPIIGLGLLEAAKFNLMDRVTRE